MSGRAICRSTGCRQTGLVVSSSPQQSGGPKGMIAATISAGAIAMMGAHMKRNLWALGGTKSSLKRNFTASAMKWVIPHNLTGPMLARLGPRRSCIIADSRRSIQVRIEASGIKKPRIMKTILMTAVRTWKPREPYSIASASGPGEAELHRQQRPAPVRVLHERQLLLGLGEDRLGLGELHGGAELARQVREDLPARQRVAGRRHRRAHPLDHAEAVGEGAVALGPFGQRQGDLGGGGRRLAAGLGDPLA